MGDDGDRQLDVALAASIRTWEVEEEARHALDLALALSISTEQIAGNAVELREQRERLLARVISR